MQIISVQVKDETNENILKQMICFYFRELVDSLELLDFLGSKDTE